jgi:hypothetical protein
MGWRRRGGHAPAAGGGSVVWSMAEGRHGTRWREATTSPAGDLLRSLLLEVSPVGRVTRLEVAASAGLLTLHPEPDESALHGNLVTPDGIRHLSLAWSPAHVLLVSGSPVGSAVGVGAADGGSLELGASRDVDVVVVTDGLVPLAGRGALLRTAERRWTWQPAGAAPAVLVELADDGEPVLAAGTSWALED